MAIRLIRTPAAIIMVSESMSSIVEHGTVDVKQFGIFLGSRAVWLATEGTA